MADTYVNYKLLGAHIQTARRARHITQEMLAERLDVSVGHVGKVERGERIVNLERLAQICLIIGTPIEDIIAGCVDKERDAIPVLSPLTRTQVDTIHTLLKGQPKRTVELATALVREVVRAMNQPEDPA